MRSTGLEATKQNKNDRKTQGKRAKRGSFFLILPADSPRTKISFSMPLKKSPPPGFKLFAKNLLTFSDSGAIIKPQQGQNL